jgi:ATPase subunit of ABC transporter with duplicated ATPase domains
MLLEAHAVSKSFGGFFAVRDANLTIDQGEIVGLIGPNGAGKSTFFRAAYGGYGYGYAQTQNSSWAPNPGMGFGGGWWNTVIIADATQATAT